MIFDQLTGALYADDGAFLKTVRCPLALRSEQLVQVSTDTSDRFCNFCQRSIRCIDELQDSDIKSALTDDESLCIFATPKAKNITFLQPIGAVYGNYENLPIIKTMRSLEAMADAQVRGFDLVFKDAGEGSTFGPEKYLVYQHKPTGKLWWSGDYRNPAPTVEEACGSDSNEWKMVRDWFYARPDRPFPLAAYAVPRDLKLGARIFIDDVIEDVLQTTWNQGNSVRIVSGAATWNGTDFDLDEPIGLIAVG